MQRKLTKPDIEAKRALLKALWPFVVREAYGPKCNYIRHITVVRAFMDGAKFVDAGKTVDPPCTGKRASQIVGQAMFQANIMRNRVRPRLPPI